MSGLLRRLPVALAVAAVSFAAACGGGEDTEKAAPGTAANPLPAAQPEDATGEPSTRPADAAKSSPGYSALLEQQTSRPRDRFTPCNLVTQREAGSIVGAAMQQPIEAPQGPTCLYRSETGKQQVALAVQAVDFDRIKPRIQALREVPVGERAAFCGEYGQPMLYVPLGGGRVLSVSGKCNVAQDFAEKALPKL